MGPRVARVATLAIAAILALAVIQGCGGSGAGEGGGGHSKPSGGNNRESDPLEHVTKGGAEVKKGCKTAHSSGSSFTCTGSGGSSP
jgi:hypothetical protein